MSKKEEAVEQLKNCEDMHIWVKPIKDYIKELEAKEERAKKVEEELEEYKISDKSKEESSIEYYNLYKETKRKLKKVEELLGLYRKLDRNIDHLTCSQIAKLDDEIDELEKELEKLK